MRPIAILAAAGGAALGAGLWALISNLTGYEIGYVAWAVGGLVGGGAAVAGGRGSTSGVVCAAFAVVAILSGRWIAFQSSSLPELRDQLGTMLTQEVYAETMTDARDLAAIHSDEQIPQFMVDHEYTEAEHAEDVHPGEAAAFRSEVAPELRKLHAEKPSYQAWRDKTIDSAVDGVKEAASPMDLKDSLGLIDIIFGFLGVATAFRLGGQPMPSEMKT
jgi:hypothetical protein